MPTFKTNPVRLDELMNDCARGEIKLPDFQRSWVWDEDRIIGLIASVSRAFPVGALMTLETGGAVQFKARPIQGAPDAAERQTARCLLLDGQQRMTSLYQTCFRDHVVETVTAKKKRVRRWFYIDMEAALAPDVDRETAIIGVPEDRIVRSHFGREIELDLSSREAEFRRGMFPVNRVLDWNDWQVNYWQFWHERQEPERMDLFFRFQNEVLQNFKGYQVPVIELDRETSRAAVCLVFEKVNTGGKPLDAFELVTATYASEGFELRKDWLGEGEETGRHPRLVVFGRAANQHHGLLKNVASTDFLQAIALRHTSTLRQQALAAGVEGREVPSVSATRQSLLDLPLAAYKAHADAIEEGFKRAAKFLRLQHVLQVQDLPYQTQLVPLAAILAELGDLWEHAAVREQLARWYWCGVFGELYGSTVESRFARDIVEVPAWLAGGPEPSMMAEGYIRADRLDSLTTRNSAAYKGVHALLMKDGALDFRSGQPFDQTVFFDESVDIHHIFPRAWCRKNGIPDAMTDSIVNKTPLTARTNRIIGGDAPSSYLRRLERGGAAPPLATDELDRFLRSHRIEPWLLRADDFHGFYKARKAALLDVIETATGTKAYRGQEADEPGEDVLDETEDSPLTSAAS